MPLRTSGNTETWMEDRLAQRDSRSASARYGIAVVCAFGALLIRFSLAAALGEKAPYVTFFLGTAVSAMYGGFGPGMLTTFLGAILAGIYVVPPHNSLAFSGTSDYVGLSLFIAVAGFMSYQAGRLINATQHANALRELFQQTLVSIGDGVVSTDEEQRVRLLNPAAEQLTGWSQAKAHGRPVEEVFRIVREGSEDPVQNPIEKVLETGRIVGLAHHTELLTKDGRRVPIDDVGAPIKDGKGGVAGAVLVFRDITQRRNAEIALQKSERRSREILESMKDAFVLVDRQWRIVGLNSATERLVGRSREALLGRNHWEEFPEAVGTEVERSYRRCVADRMPVHFEFNHEAWGRWFEIDAYPSGDELAVYFRGTTERKQSEAALRRLNEDLKQFTFAATHDLREPLRMITVYAQMLERRLDAQLDEASRSYIEQVIKGGERASRLIDGLLEFSRIGEVEEAKPGRVSSEAALDEALSDLQIATTESRAIITRETLPDVVADAVHLCQLFQNLVGNAIKYRKPGTVPEVRINAQRDGANCVFSVQDNGVGIDPQHFAQIFVPFKRLHGLELAGAGIGLATCKRIVER
ncbi:MAG: sensor signal transduction histidine kinase, partial [Bryobacterales bacterium]|nr:sensor signal transduction histidine kinase [Bryobacterales bacterium]